MKILRSVNRRGFNLGTAGWFTIQKPSTWFAASRLPNTSYHLSGQSKAVIRHAQESPARRQAGVHTTLGDSHNLEAAMPMQAMKLSPH